MSTHKIKALRTGFTNGMDWEAEYLVTFEFRKGSHDYWDRSLGAWLPGDPAEIEATDIKPVIGGFGDDRTKAEALDWAQEWIQDEGLSDAMEEVASDIEAAREFNEEVRRDR